MDTLNLIAAFLGVFIIIFLMVAVTRDKWDPPKIGKGTPRYSKKDRQPPITTKIGRPMVLRGESVGVYVKEEIKDFKQFLKRIGGSVSTEKRQIPISKTKGRLIKWSYKPFREGNWWDMVHSGIRNPEWPCFFGTPSLVPNPSGYQPESPLTLVKSEEDVIRCVGGEATIRVFHPNQPTFPKFKKDEHQDMICRKTVQKIKGEEFVLSGGDVVMIPRGWAYRARLSGDCVALFRIPIHGIYSYIKTMLN
jgi:hypothetical protein